MWPTGEGHTGVWYSLWPTREGPTRCMILWSTREGHTGVWYSLWPTRVGPTRCVILWSTWEGHTGCVIQSVAHRRETYWVCDIVYGQHERDMLGVRYSLWPTREGPTRCVILSTTHTRRSYSVCDTVNDPHEKVILSVWYCLWSTREGTYWVCDTISGPHENGILVAWCNLRPKDHSFEPFSYQEDSVWLQWQNIFPTTYSYNYGSGRHSVCVPIIFVTPCGANVLKMFPVAWRLSRPSFLYFLMYSFSRLISHQTSAPCVFVHLACLQEAIYKRFFSRSRPHQTRSTYLVFPGVFPGSPDQEHLPCLPGRFSGTARRTRRWRRWWPEPAPPWGRRRCRPRFPRPGRWPWSSCPRPARRCPCPSTICCTASVSSRSPVAPGWPWTVCPCTGNLPTWEETSSYIMSCSCHFLCRLLRWVREWVWRPAMLYSFAFSCLLQWVCGCSECVICYTALCFVVFCSEKMYISSTATSRIDGMPTEIVM